jgi:hypothetical protein
VIVVSKYVDKNPSEDDLSWPKHVNDNWMSTLSIILNGVIKLYIINYPQFINYEP